MLYPQGLTKTLHQPLPRGAAQSRAPDTPVPQVVTLTTPLPPWMTHFSAPAPAPAMATIVSPLVTQLLLPAPPPGRAHLTSLPRAPPVSPAATQILTPPPPLGMAHLLSPALAPAPGVTRSLTRVMMDPWPLIAGLTYTHTCPCREVSPDTCHLGILEQFLQCHRMRTVIVMMMLARVSLMAKLILAIHICVMHVTTSAGVKRK